MRATEFLEACAKDIETHKDREKLGAIIEGMREVLAGSTAEIDAQKNVEECFASMRDFASKHKKDDCYSMSPNTALKVIAEYLGVKESENPTQPQTRSTQRRRTIRSLEDFL